jgi:Creatinine amidohydrolase
MNGERLALNRGEMESCMRRSLRLVLMVVAASCIPAHIGAQTNPLWSEQKLKNFLPHMTWPDVRDLLTRSDMVLIPIPALEQHGFHGPIGTDYCQLRGGSAQSGNARRRGESV